VNAPLDGSCVLVTGATGLIGSSLVALLVGRPCRLRLLARARPMTLPAGRAHTDVLIGDMRNPELLERAIDGVDVVFHLAAQTSARVAQRDPRVDWELNVQPVLHFLDWFRRKGRHPIVVLAGSETQAGIPSTLPLDETAPDRPLTVYDVHKLMAEQYLELYARLGLVRGTCLRLPTVYGPGPRERGEDRGLIGGTIQRALAGEVLRIHKGGAYLRDFLHVADAARGFLAAASAIDCLSGRHFLLGTGIGRPVAEAIQLVGEAVREQTSLVVSVETVGRPEGWSSLDEGNVVIDASSFATATDWAPMISLEAGVSSTVSALLARRGGPGARIR